MPEIIKEWVGYNGKLTQEKKPDGTTKKTKHNKIWAAALTDTGHVYVRYGPSKQPLKLTEQIIRPKPGLSESEALTEAERIFDEKVNEKRSPQKGYDAISFGVAPHYVPSFSKWRMSNEPEEIVAPLSAAETFPPAESAGTLEETLHHLSACLLAEPCSCCHTHHVRYLVDLGDGKVYTPDMIIDFLHQTEQGAAWLTVPCVRKEQLLLHAQTQELLAILCDLVETSEMCTFKTLDIPARR